MSSPALIQSSTILLVRDAPDLEVLMVERHHQIDFASGALVFPGGKAAPGDALRDWDGFVDGGEGVCAQERALRICALREAFEESGLLLAHCADTGALASPARGGAIWAQRAALAKDQASFVDLIRADGLRLALDALIPYAHWITPEGMPKRFDTRFFIAAAPSDQVARQDGDEAVDAIWTTPADALDQNRAGARKIIFPTRLNLELLAQSTRTHDALNAARTRTIITVTPRIVAGADGGLELTIPPEAGYGIVREPLAPNMP